MDRKKLIDLRRDLHKHPELSGMEKNTAKRIKTFLKNCPPDKIIENIGGYGFIAIYQGKKPGKKVMFRADMDALPIEETIDITYRSVTNGVSHKCGHDGHSTILAGVAEYFHHHPPEHGEVMLLFQPAEENAQGAAAMLKDEKMKDVKPDYVFGLHNLPGFPLHQIITRTGTVTAASKGLMIELTGRTSHAAEPEKGINPARGIARMIEALQEIPARKNTFHDFTLITIIHVNLGEKAFGTSPGLGRVYATLRSYENTDMERLTGEALDAIKHIAREEKLDYTLEFTDDFLATKNHPDAVKMVKEVARELHLDSSEPGEPFRWSEDFSFFADRFPAGFFMLGAGEDHPRLHYSDYDFPEELMETGINMFTSIAQKILG